MPPADEELEGTTLRVYLYVVREDKPVGPRDVMRGTNLSSPSVAYRHLQKLETLGLIQRDNYGEYTAKEKANIKGHLWIGKNLIPRLIIYSFFFIGILTAEIATITLRLTTDQPISTEHIILTLTTTTATILLLTEGVILHLKTKTA